MKKRNRPKEWLVFVGIAVLVHLALFLYIKPDFFLAFRTLAPNQPSTAPHGSRVPDAILYIPVEITDDVQSEPVQELVEVPSEQDRVEPTDVNRPPKSGAPDQPDVSLDKMLGDASQTLPQGPGVNTIEIPPRPLEITWPDTQKLKHCLGHQIDVRVEVGDDGAILQIEVDEQGHPPDCVAAALESARQIVFAPGRVGGKPATMWTQIRIDFEKRR